MVFVCAMKVVLGVWGHKSRMLRSFLRQLWVMMCVVFWGWGARLVMKDSKCNSAAEKTPPLRTPHWETGSAVLKLVLASKPHRPRSNQTLQSKIAALEEKLESIQSLAVVILLQDHCMAPRSELHNHYMETRLVARGVLHGEEILLVEDCCQRT